MGSLIDDSNSFPEHFNGPTELFPDKESLFSEIKFSKKKDDGFCAVIKKSPGEAKSFVETGYYIGVDRFPGTNQCLYVEPKLNISSEEEDETLVEVDYLQMLFESLQNGLLFSTCCSPSLPVVQTLRF